MPGNDDFAPKYRNAAFGLLAIAVIALSVALALPFLPAILWATVLSILLFPLYRRLRDRLMGVGFLRNAGDSVASVLTTLVALFVICIPFALIGYGVYSQGQSIANEIAGEGQALTTDSVIRYLDKSVRPVAAQFGAKDFSLSDYVAQNRPALVAQIRAPLGRFATQTGFTVLTLVIALLTMFFMLRDGERAREPALDLLPLPRERSVEILQRIADTVRAVFIGTVLVAIIQGAIMGVAYYFVGLPNALLLGVFSILLCIIPLLGAPVLYIPVGLFFLLQGDLKSALIILGVGGLIVSQIDNVLKPIFIAGRANLHPMLVFFAILGGVLLVGPIGVMAGPMLLTILLAVGEVTRERLGHAQGILKSTENA